jgi:phosphoglycerate dehydrogenase-like enzyme
MAYRCAILDDYQNVALKLADWGRIAGDVEIKAFNDAVRRSDEDTIREFKDFDIVVIMRERTRFPRPVIDGLPKLKLLITTGFTMPRSTWPPARSAASWSAAPELRQSHHRMPSGLILNSPAESAGRMHA